MDYTKEQYSDKRYVWHMAEAKEWVCTFRYYGNGDDYGYVYGNGGDGYGGGNGYSSGYGNGYSSGYGYDY